MAPVVAAAAAAAAAAALADAAAVEVVAVVDAIVVVDPLQGDAESTGEGVAVVAFEDGRGDLEAEHGGADEGSHSRLELGTEDVEAVALGGGLVSGDSVVVAAAAAAVDLEKPLLAQPSRLSERIWPTVASAQRERICQPYQANTSAPVCARCRNV